MLMQIKAVRGLKLWSRPSRSRSPPQRVRSMKTVMPELWKAFVRGLCIVKPTLPRRVGFTLQVFKTFSVKTIVFNISLLLACEYKYSKTRNSLISEFHNVSLQKRQFRVEAGPGSGWQSFPFISRPPRSERELLVCHNTRKILALYLITAE